MGILWHIGNHCPNGIRIRIALHINDLTHYIGFSKVTIGQLFCQDNTPQIIQRGFRVAAHSESVSQSSRTSIEDGVRWKT